MSRVVIAPYKSGKYDVERALEESMVEYDDIVYVFDSWVEMSLDEMMDRVRKLVEMVDAREVYIIGAGYIPAVISIWQVIVNEKGDLYNKIILLDYDTIKRRYRRRVVKGGE